MYMTTHTQMSATVQVSTLSYLQRHVLRLKSATQLMLKVVIQLFGLRTIHSMHVCRCDCGSHQCRDNDDIIIIDIIISYYYGLGIIISYYQDF